MSYNLVGYSGLRLFLVKLSAREKLVGWYHTGPRLRSSDQEINDLMKQFIPKPVMVIVDPRSRDTGIPTDAYFAVEEIKDVSGLMSICCMSMLLTSLPFDVRRTAQQHKEPSHTHHRQSLLKSQKKLGLSICFETFEILPLLDPSLVESRISYNL